MERKKIIRYNTSLLKTVTIISDVEIKATYMRTIHNLNA